MKIKYSLFHSLILTLLMTLPLIAGIAFLTGVTYSMWSEYKRYAQSLKPEGWPIQSSLAVLSDGTPVIERYSRRRNSYGSRLTTMDGREVLPDAPTLHGITFQPDSDQIVRRLQFRNRLVAPIELLRYQAPQQYIDPEHPRDIWLFRESDRNPGAYYLIKTDRDRQQVISGYFDRNGPRQDEPGPETSFGEPSGIIESKGVILFQSGTELLAVDLNNKSTAKISDQNVLRWGFRQGHSNAEHRPEIILVTDDAIRSVDYGGKETHSYPISGNEFLQLYVTDDDRLLVRTAGEYEPDTTPAGRIVKQTETLYELSDDGQSHEIAQFPSRTSTFSPEAENDFLRGMDRFIGQTGLGIMFPGPAVLLGLQSGGAYMASRYGNRDTGFTESWRIIQKESPWAIPMSALLGAITAYFCHRRQRRYQAAWTKMWTAFVFLFGPAGYLAWRWHREWPPLELVGVTNDTFDGPAANGLEVFA